ncbi:DUF4145 domain-containing protein [Massilia jejuensis]|uniref:DUF4145 domain-containing protein n=1 Tax=Massilia jejuensis TaxID=648894 RepID=A0ABW0PFM5_9BURK
MSELSADCPRCGVKEVTFDVVGAIPVGGQQILQRYEAQCGCRRCKCSTVFVLQTANIDAQKYIYHNGVAHLNGSLDGLVNIIDYVSVRDINTASPPPDMPEAIAKVFTEGATCMSVDCYNAAATMFRLCIDLATKSRLPSSDVDGLNNKVRRNLGLRLPWLFKHGHIPAALEELSSCIKEDGNDGAHEGTLEKVDAEDIMDFTRMLLERLYTEPAQLARANARREARRAGG